MILKQAEIYKWNTIIDFHWLLSTLYDERISELYRKFCVINLAIDKQLSYRSFAFFCHDILECQFTHSKWMRVVPIIHAWMQQCGHLKAQ